MYKEIDNYRKTDEKAVKNKIRVFSFAMKRGELRAVRSAANRCTQLHCIKGKLKKTIVIRH